MKMEKQATFAPEGDPRIETPSGACLWRGVVFVVDLCLFTREIDL